MISSGPNGFCGTTKRTTHIIDPPPLPPNPDEITLRTLCGIDVTTNYFAMTEPGAYQEFNCAACIEEGLRRWGPSDLEDGRP